MVEQKSIKPWISGKYQDHFSQALGTSNIIYESLVEPLDIAKNIKSCTTYKVKGKFVIRHFLIRIYCSLDPIPLKRDIISFTFMSYF